MSSLLVQMIYVSPEAGGEGACARELTRGYLICERVVKVYCRTLRCRGETVIEAAPRKALQKRNAAPVAAPGSLRNHCSQRQFVAGAIQGEITLDKKMAGLLGAVAALGTLGAAQATPAPAPTDVLAANSYAELLQPIPDASARLKALDKEQRAGADAKGIQLAYRHHHHHHHHSYRRPRRHHHHHHHH